MHRMLLPSSNKFSSLISLGNGWKNMHTCYWFRTLSCFLDHSAFCDKLYLPAFLNCLFVFWDHHLADIWRVSTFVNEIIVNCLKLSLPCRSSISLSMTVQATFLAPVSYALKNTTISCSAKLTNAKRQLTTKNIIKKVKAVWTLNY